MRRILKTVISLLCVFALACTLCVIPRASESELIPAPANLRTAYFEPFMSSSRERPYGLIGSAVYDGSFRSEMSEASKQIYDAILANIESTKSGTADIVTTFETPVPSSSFHSATVWTAVQAFYYDHPEYFWMDYDKLAYGYEMNATRTAVTTVTLGYYDTYYSHYLGAPYTSQADVETAIAQVDAVLAEIRLTLGEKAGKYEKLKAAHDWIVLNSEYNTQIAYAAPEELNSFSVYYWSPASVFLSNNDPEEGPICEAYARALKMLCDEIGIPCVLVSGWTTFDDASGEYGGGHMWVYVKMNGKWFAIDATWDDPINGYSSISTATRYRFFLVGSDTVTYMSDTFSTDHFPNAAPFTGCSFVYPALNPIAFDMAVDLLKATAIAVAGDESIGLSDTPIYTASVAPIDVDDDRVIWSVIDVTGSATIDQNGVLTPISGGSVIVRATSADGSGTYGELAVEIIGVDMAWEQVITNIGLIGTVTLESAPSIELARASYDALSEQSKLLVDNYDALLAAETEYEALRGAVVLGDYNADTNASITDLVLLRDALAAEIEFSAYLMCAIDMNGDANVTITDLVLLRDYLAGLGD